MQIIHHKPKPDPRLMTQTELYAYIHELEADKQELRIRHNLSINAYIAKINAFGETIKNLKAENARLEEGYQKSIGVIAATDCVECKQYDSDVNRAISIIREFCRSNDECGTCAASEKDGCMFVDYPDAWENRTALIDGGVSDEQNGI